MANSSIQAEAMGILLGMQETSTNFERVEVLTDILEMVRALRDPNLAPLEVIHIVQDILTLANSLKDFPIFIVPRCLVAKTHDLAQKLEEGCSFFCCLYSSKK